MPTDLNAFSNDTLTATQRISAMDDAYNTLVGNFVGEQQAFLTVTQGLNTLKTNAQAAGATMTGTNAASVSLQQSFYGQAGAVEQAANAMLQNGDSTKQVTGYIDTQIGKLADYKGHSASATLAVQDLRRWEDTLTGSLQKQATFMSTTLDNDLQAAILKYSGVTTAVNNYGAAAVQFGPKSQQALNAQKLMNDAIVKGGIAAGQSTTQIATMISKMDKIPLKEAIQIVLNAEGQYSVSEVAATVKKANPKNQSLPGNYPGGTGAAAGWYVSGGTPGRDSVPIMAMPGELVVPTRMVNAGAVDHLRGRIPGFAGGGLVSGTYSGTAPGLGAWNASEYNATIAASIKALESTVAAATKAAKTAAVASAVSSAPGALGGPTSASVAQAQAYARSRLGTYGWAASQMNSLIPLWVRESGWSRVARNPSSGAYGIPQALPASKMGAAANPPTSSAAAQINWGLSYIKGRYGSPAGAESHESSFGWYAGGTGGAAPGWAVVGDGGGPELVKMSGGETVLPAHVTSHILGGTMSYPGYAKGTSNVSAASIAGLISGAPKGGWQKDVSDLKSELKIIAATLGIKGLTKADLSKLKGEQGSDETELLVATAYLSALVKARKQITSVTEPKLKTQIAALTALGKTGKLSASETRLLAKLKASLAGQEAEAAKIYTAIYGKTTAKPKAAAASSSASSGSSGSDGSSSASASSSGPAPGRFVGTLPSPPGLGGADITGGGTGGLGGTGSTITGIGALGAGYTITPSASTVDSQLASIFGGSGGSGMGQQLLAELQKLNAAQERHIAVARAAPAATGGSLSNALNGVARQAYHSARYNTGSSFP